MSRRVRSPLPAALLVLAGGVAGCGGAATGAADARALMAPGQDCTVCHGFPVAGTIFADAPAHHRPLTPQESSARAPDS